MEISWPEHITRSFRILEKIGEGSFGYVYKAKNSYGKHVAIKLVKPTCSSSRTLKEIQILHKIRYHRSVIKMLTCYRRLDMVFIFFPYVESEKFANVYRTFTMKDTQIYISNLLDALAYIHNRQIIHRDVKPNNFLFNRKTKHFCLIDFGLSQDLSNNEQNKTNLFNNNNHFDDNSKCYHSMESVCDVCLSKPKQEAKRSGTSGYRAPEILMKYEQQGPEIDVWSAGIILLTLLSGRYPFFKAKDDLNALEQIIQIFGLEAIKESAHQINKVVTRSNHNDIYYDSIKKSSVFYHFIKKNKNSNSKQFIEDSFHDKLYHILWYLCVQFRSDCCDNNDRSTCCLLCCAPIEFFQILARFLNPSHKRATAEQLLNDNFFRINFC